MRDKRILIIEDEADIADLVALHLRDMHMHVSIANDGHAGMRLACSKRWDLILLDLRLPGPSGLEICQALRRNENYTPILMLTSKATELDRVLGLEIGADDYVTKPFSIMELMARVKAIFRRLDAIDKAHQQPSSLLEIGALRIDTATRQVWVNEKLAELTAREFDLLTHFASHPGRVFKRAELLDQVWGIGHEGYEHTVNSHINRLRAKIEPRAATPACIVTVWGVGYKLDPSFTEKMAS